MVNLAAMDLTPRKDSLMCQISECELVIMGGCMRRSNDEHGFLFDTRSEKLSKLDKFESSFQFWGGHGRRTTAGKSGKGKIIALVATQGDDRLVTYRQGKNNFKVLKQV